MARPWQLLLGCCADPACDLGSGVEPELVQNAANVAVDGTLRDEKARPDLLVAESVGDEQRDLSLSFREQAHPSAV